MDGPYGAGNQDWGNYETCIMIGAGIGVTPYASILLDAVHAMNGNGYSDAICKKIYFVWICPTYKHYDWFVEVLRKAEEADHKNTLEMHVFVTQYFHKYDLRTTMLYICEKHFRVQQGCSMFTNLKATNHFGRPNVSPLLRYFRDRHQKIERIGVFSCGPRSVNKSVHEACDEVNSDRKVPHLVHKYETF
ncbi:unnamed protein product [Soboliphyme baturini]|uniref:NAD(P)H oxidase (H2O2-forming) n=1 Tax=Soboliphyme baturini TaxID=241478 RepID=A0A183IAA7_9BILA|nr:unnamed protein product [Soboliphyme baturini]